MTVLAGIASLEEATVDASAVVEEEDIDGWRIRWSPGKAKRSRSVQALAQGQWSLDAKLDVVVARYRAVGLPPLVRVAPVSQPTGLDDALASRGWTRFDETVVMVLRPLAGSQHSLPTTCREVRPAAHARWVGVQRGSAADEIEAHAARLLGSPVPYRAMHLLDPDGVTVAGGQVAIDGKGRAGLYDVFVAAEHRRRGAARALCGALLTAARAGGAALAYLQVDGGNAPARALYRSMGFVDSHRYHYREAPDPTLPG